MDDYQDIIYTKRDGVAKVSINRPQVLNAFRPLTIDEMRDAFQDAWNDTQVGVVVLTGENGNFCTGGDVKTAEKAATRTKPAVFACMLPISTGCSARFPSPSSQWSTATLSAEDTCSTYFAT